MDIDELCLKIGYSLQNSGASDVEVLNVEEKTKSSRRLVLCTAEDNQKAKELFKVVEGFNSLMPILSVDGITKGDWICVDIKDVIVHIFTPKARQKYNLEKLYKDTKNSLKL